MRAESINSIVILLTSTLVKDKLLVKITNNLSIYTLLWIRVILSIIWTCCTFVIIYNITLITITTFICLIIVSIRSTNRLTRMRQVIEVCTRWADSTWTTYHIITINTRTWFASILLVRSAYRNALLFIIKSITISTIYWDTCTIV